MDMVNIRDLFRKQEEYASDSDDWRMGQKHP